MPLERRSITVRGIVQGVGFRPCVHRLANQHGLSGFVQNRGGEVRIEAEGETASLERFLEDLRTSAPPLARIDAVSQDSIPPTGENGFAVAPSDLRASSDIAIAPDMATCPACLAELFDPADRRYRYPFLNCTDCGPRLTIVRGAPYDRARTTMASFAMCPACQAEYDSPTDRRFHAQPTACADCGPRLTALLPGGKIIEMDDPLADFVQAIQSGKIGALKGLGGYHLVCDARNEQAVSELRCRKHREEKPLAVMVADVEAARELCHIARQEEDLLTSPRRPIVLLHRRPESDTLAPSVAPGNPCVGVLLPYTPLHHLLMRDAGDAPLVMTSGNRSDEPIAYEDEDALTRLAGIADIFLTHDRPIQVRCDDSVTRVVADGESPMRRSRGYAPTPVRLPVECGGPVLAVGGQLKNTFALARGDQAIVSHHLGDLDDYQAYRAFECDIGRYEELFDAAPQVIVHDLHPDYASTQYAQRRAAEEGLQLLAVQHHHAHLASCMAEHGLTEPVIGVSFDGTGYGPDGSVWGGEFLLGDYATWRRAAHLRCVHLPGGDSAVKEVWRMALSHLADAEVGYWEFRLPQGGQEVVQQMIRSGFNSPWTSSAGRLFDAVAATVGVRQQVRHEGQAAMELEWLATGVEDDSIYEFAFNRTGGKPQACSTPPVGWAPSEADEIDTRPLIRAIAQDVQAGVAPGVIARRFHRTMARIVVETCRRLQASSGVSTVTLSGGVFQNALLLEETTANLTESGFRVYRHSIVPANDGGLSFGQAAIAATFV